MTIQSDHFFVLSNDGFGGGADSFGGGGDFYVSEAGFYGWEASNLVVADDGFGNLVDITGGTDKLVLASADQTVGVALVSQPGSGTGETTYTDLRVTGNIGDEERVDRGAGIFGLGSLILDHTDIVQDVSYPGSDDDTGVSNTVSQAEVRRIDNETVEQEVKLPSGDIVITNSFPRITGDVGDGALELPGINLVTQAEALDSARAQDRADNVFQSRTEAQQVQYNIYQEVINEAQANRAEIVSSVIATELAYQSGQSDERVIGPGIDGSIRELDTDEGLSYVDRIQVIAEAIIQENPKAIAQVNLGMVNPIDYGYDVNLKSFPSDLDADAYAQARVDQLERIVNTGIDAVITGYQLQQQIVTQNIDSFLITNQDGTVEVLPYTRNEIVTNTLNDPLAAEAIKRAIDASNGDLSDADLRLTSLRSTSTVDIADPVYDSISEDLSRDPIFDPRIIEPVYDSINEDEDSRYINLNVDDPLNYELDPYDDPWYSDAVIDDPVYDATNEDEYSLFDDPVVEEPVYDATNEDEYSLFDDPVVEEPVYDTTNEEVSEYEYVYEDDNVVEEPVYDEINEDEYVYQEETTDEDPLYNITNDDVIDEYLLDDLDTVVPESDPTFNLIDQFDNRIESSNIVVSDANLLTRSLTNDGISQSNISTTAQDVATDSVPSTVQDNIFTSFRLASSTQTSAEVSLTSGALTETQVAQEALSNELQVSNVSNVNAAALTAFVATATSTDFNTAQDLALEKARQQAYDTFGSSTGFGGLDQVNVKFNDNGTYTATYTVGAFDNVNSNTVSDADPWAVETDATTSDSNYWTGEDGELLVSPDDLFTETDGGLNVLTSEISEDEIYTEDDTTVNGESASTYPFGVAYDDDGNLMPGWAISDETGEPYYIGGDYVDPGTLESAEQSRLQALLNQARNQTTLQNQRKQVNNGDWRVRLSLAPNSQYLYNLPESERGILDPLFPTNGVIFPYTPAIDTSYKANYNTYDLTHSNYRGYFYQNSYVDAINLRATFTAQDTNEANYLLAVIHFFKSVTKMFYGQDVQRGSPPPLCYLTGLGEYQFNGHPCLVNEFRLSLPDNVDYIRTGSVNINGTDLIFRRDRVSVPTNPILAVLGRLINAGLTKGAEPQVQAPPTLGLNSPTYVPTKMEINLTLLPVQSRSQVSKQFSVKNFANGNLLKGGFW